MSLRILLADDHVVVREAIRFLLQREGFSIVGEASDGQCAVKMCTALQPDIALLDISMPVLNGIEAAREIVRGVPHTKVVILTEHVLDQYVLECLHIGVKGYVLKGDTGEELVDALRAVLSGGMYVTPSLKPLTLQCRPSNTSLKDTLGVQERRVLQLIAEGKNIKEIGQLLDISHKTVQSHRANIMNKLGIQGTAGLVRYAIRSRLICVGIHIDGLESVRRGTT